MQKKKKLFYDYKKFIDLNNQINEHKRNKV